MFPILSKQKRSLASSSTPDRGLAAARKPSAWSRLRSVVGAVALAGAFGVVCPTAHAVVVHGTNEAMRINGGVADFGSGTHAGGIPIGTASIAWDYSVVNGQIMATARVLGVLFYDSLDPGIARAVVEFKRLDGTIISSHTFQTRAPFSPGGNANLLANKTGVDIQRSSPLLHSVTIKLFEVLPTGARPTTPAQSSVAPRQFIKNVIINSGHGDFGNGFHAPVSPLDGTPTLPARVTFTRTNGLMQVNVSGTLYWDNAFGSGTAALDIDFLNQAGVQIGGPAPAQEVGTGGNANLAVNKTSISRNFQAGSVTAVRLTAGELVNGSSFQHSSDPVIIRFND